MKKRLPIMLVITMIALSFIPALYNLIFLSSMWNPYGETQNLPVAIVNLDRSAQMSGKTISLGDDLVTNLKKK